MPAAVDPTNVYAATGPAHLSAAVTGDRRLVYVPNGRSNTLTVIDERTHRVLRTVAVGRQPEHVVPSYDLRTLWVTSDAGNSLARIDPRTGRVTATVHVRDPYNLYFTPDGRYALVVAERMQRLDFRDPQTMALRHTMAVRCPGIDHLDFAGSGRYFLASCEFGRRLIKVDTIRRRVVASLQLPAGSSPQDVRVAPDGHTFYVADQGANGVWRVDGARLRNHRLIHTGTGAHGLYPSRDARRLYVTNRRAGSISVLDFRTGAHVATWRLPAGSSPDMGGVNVAGTRLWLAARYSDVIYLIDTRAGRLVTTIRVGLGPHGLAVFPQPGRYSLGHTANMR